jgi:hypothetical protein
LRPLKADQDDRGEYEGEQAGGYLQIALQDGIGFEGNNPEPHGEEEKDNESGDTRQDGSYTAAAGIQNRLGHSCCFCFGPGALSN